MLFKDIVLPIVIALFSLSVIVIIINIIFRFFRLDIAILKFIALIAVWYYVGPKIYDWLLYKVITTPNEAIRIIYMPIQSILQVFDKIV